MSIPETSLHVSDVKLTSFLLSGIWQAVALLRGEGVSFTLKDLASSLRAIAGSLETFDLSQVEGKDQKEVDEQTLTVHKYPRSVAMPEQKGRIKKTTQQKKK